MDISTGGLCFFADRFMHEGTTCELTLQLPDGETILVSGGVVRCQLIKGRVHEIGIKLFQAFDMGVLQSEVPAASMSPDARDGGGDHPNLSRDEGSNPVGAAAATGVLPSAASGARSAAEAAMLEELRQRLPANAIELKMLAERIAGLHECSTRLDEIGRELHLGSRAG